jgi:broad specificity phosphatase PhoE
MARMKTILLIRHAETSMAGRLCGHSDPDLNVAGEMQLARIAHQAAVAGVQRIVSSDLRRAVQTANAVGQKVGVPVEQRSALREIHFGLWDGLNWSEVEARFPREARAWAEGFPKVSAPEGESYGSFTRKIDNELTSLMGEGRDQVTAIVTHRGVIRYALTRFFGRSEQDAFDQTAAYGAVIPVTFLADIPKVTL